MIHRALLAVLAVVTLAPVAQANLVLHWKLDEAASATSVADASSNGFTGTVEGTPTFDPSGGKIGGAVHFNTVDDENINVFSNAIVGDYPFTIAAWVKPTSTGNHTVAVLGTGQFDKYYSIRVTSGNATVTRRQNAFHDANGGPVFDGEWHHVVGVFDGSSLRSVYVDGVFKGSNTGDDGGFTAVDRFAIGALNRTTGSIVDEYGGWVDDVQLYSAALTSDEIASLYANPGSVIPEPATLLAMGVVGLAGMRRR